MGAQWALDAFPQAKLLRYLGTCSPLVPFLLLLPAWVAGTDYWRDFLRTLAAARQPLVRGRRSLERRAGVFYVCPRRRYAFVHPEGTGHADAPFHSIWFCGGWRTNKARKRAVRALRRAARVPQAPSASAGVRAGGAANAAEAAGAAEAGGAAAATPRIEVFRAARMLQKRGFFQPGALGKRRRVG